MFNIATLQTCLQDVVGFQQTDNPKVPALDADLLVSESGLYFQQEHPLVDLEVLHSVAQQFESYIYDTWDVGTTYSLGQRVRDSEINYEYIDASPSAGNLTSDGNFWKTVALFSPFLRQMRAQSIAKVLNKYRTNKQLKEITKTALDRMKLYDVPGRLKDKEIRKSRFVGFEIIPEYSEGIKLTIHRLGTQFDTPQNGKVFYVYHTSQVDAIFTIDIDIVKTGSFEWHNILDANNNTLDLTYLDEAYDSGGRWYLGYFENDFTGMAVIKKFDFNNGPCHSCSGVDYRRYQQWSPWISINPIAVPDSALNGTSLFDVDAILYPTSNNFGLNLDVSVNCDITDIFCTQKHLLADAISKQFAVDLAEEIAYSIRNNRIKDKQQQNAIMALDTDSNKNPGLSAKLNNSIKALEFDFSSLGEVCVPCNQEEGVLWGSI
jgi:hypothetical protein